MLRSGRNESTALLAELAILLACDAMPPADLAADPIELNAEALEPIPIIFMIPAPLSAIEPIVEAMPPALSASPVAVEARLEAFELAPDKAFIGAVKGVIILPMKLLDSGAGV